MDAATSLISASPPVGVGLKSEPEDIEVQILEDIAVDHFVSSGDAGGGGYGADSGIVKQLLSRVQVLEHQVASCLESQPLLYQLFNKCNRLERRLKAMKKNVDERLEDLGEEGKKEGGDSGSDSSGADSDSDVDVSSDGSDPDPAYVPDLQHDEEEDDPNRDELDQLDTESKSDEEDRGPDVAMEEDDPSNLGAHSDPEAAEESATGNSPSKSTRSRSRQEQTTRPATEMEMMAKPQPPSKSQPTLITITLNQQKKKPRSLIPCSNCELTFVNNWTLTRHLKTIHPESIDSPASYQCDYCDRQFRRSDKLLKHKRSAHPGEPERPTKPAPPTPTVAPSVPLEPGAYFCPDCQQSFANNWTLTRHMDRFHAVSTDSIGRFECDLCLKTYPHKDKVLLHQKQVHGGVSEAFRKAHQSLRPLPSPRPSLPREATTKRQRTENSDKPKTHCCDTCGRAFHHAKDLRAHQRIHTGERPYACPHCEKRFIQQNGLTFHMTLHTGKPYTCDECGWAFARAQTLKKHKECHAKGTVRTLPPEKRQEKPPPQTHDSQPSYYMDKNGKMVKRRFRPNQYRHRPLRPRPLLPIKETTNTSTTEPEPGTSSA